MTTSRIELVILEELRAGDITLVADELLKRWLRDELTREEQIIVGNFLLNAGYLSTLKGQYLRLLTQDKFISWVPLLELLQRTNVKIPKETLEQIVVGMTEQDNLEELVQVKNFANSHERLKSVYQKLLDEKIEKIKNKKKDLLEKLQRAVNDRLDDEAQKISTELKEIFPKDEQVQDIASELDIARIKNLLKKKEQELAEKIDWSIPDDLEAEKKQLFESSHEAAAKNPAQAYDIAIMLTQVDAFEEALTCLNFAPPSFSKDWLKMDLLIRSKNFIAALNESLELEKKYSTNPDTIFSALLLRSQALHGLGEKEKAIQILEKIIEIQPKNQNARILLHHWRSST
jgi:hypothetical protein